MRKTAHAIISPAPDVLIVTGAFIIKRICINHNDKPIFLLVNLTFSFEKVTMAM